MNKVYIGDSVYAEFDGYCIVLTTENGMPGDPSNRIVMEPEVVNDFFRYVNSLKDKRPCTPSAKPSEPTPAP